MREINEANNKQTLQRPLGSHRNEVQMAAQWWRFPIAHIEERLPSVSSRIVAAPRGHFSTMAKQPQLRERYATSRLGSPRASHCFILICSFVRKTTQHMPDVYILSLRDTVIGSSRKQATASSSQISHCCSSYQMKRGRLNSSLFIFKVISDGEDLWSLCLWTIRFLGQIVLQWKQIQGFLRSLKNGWMQRDLLTQQSPAG